jgi:orotate phosphoribosyltransferase
VLTRQTTEDIMVYGGKNGMADLREVVQHTVRDLMPHLSKFDSIAATGTSGLVVAAPVSVLTGIPLVVVRKKHDQSHSGRILENPAEMGKRVLFLDDFISTGRTRAWVTYNVRLEKGHVVGQYTYYSEGRGELKWLDSAEEQAKLTRDYDGDEIVWDDPEPSW